MNHRLLRLGVALAVSVGCLSACSSAAAKPPLSSGLVAASDLPGRWAPFTPSKASTTDLCGQPSRADLPRPTDSAAVGYAVDPSNGPIFGERIERYARPSDATAALHADLHLPCDFEKSDGSRWHTERLAPQAIGPTADVVLVTSRDRPDSFNYEASIVSGDVAVRVALNVRQEDRAQLVDLLRIAWDAATSAGVSTSKTG